MDRYVRNMNSISKEETKKLHGLKICVVGCGGLGGYVIEMLSRIGIGYITGIDPDVFDVSNLNRQIISTMANIGCKKALEAKKRVASINPDVNFTPVLTAITKENALDILANHDLVIDAVDSIQTRITLQDACSTIGIPLVHGAIAGWYGQVSVVMPGDNTLSKLYADANDKGAETELGNPAFIPATVASIEVCEAIKVLLNKGEFLRNKLLYIDLLNNSYDIVTV